jgi:hypothetical protein
VGRCWLPTRRVFLAAHLGKGGQGGLASCAGGSHSVTVVIQDCTSRLVTQIALSFETILGASGQAGHRLAHHTGGLLLPGEKTCHSHVSPWVPNLYLAWEVCAVEPQRSGAIAPLSSAPVPDSEGSN